MLNHPKKISRLMLCFLSPQISQIYTDFIVRHFGVGVNLRKSA